MTIALKDNRIKYLYFLLFSVFLISLTFKKAHSDSSARDKFETANKIRYNNIIKMKNVRIKIQSDIKKLEQRPKTRRNKEELSKLYSRKRTVEQWLKNELSLYKNNIKNQRSFSILEQRVKESAKTKAAKPKINEQALKRKLENLAKTPRTDNQNETKRRKLNKQEETPSLSPTSTESHKSFIMKMTSNLNDISQQAGTPEQFNTNTICYNWPVAPTFNQSLSKIIKELNKYKRFVAQYNTEQRNSDRSLSNQKLDFGQAFAVLKKINELYKHILLKSQNPINDYRNAVIEARTMSEENTVLHGMTLFLKNISKRNNPSSFLPRGIDFNMLKNEFTSLKKMHDKLAILEADFRKDEKSRNPHKTSNLLPKLHHIKSYERYHHLLNIIKQ